MSTIRPDPGSLSMLEFPAELNYVAVFLTLDCNLNCSYCINDPRQLGGRKALFQDERHVMSPGQWVKALSRIKFSPDLPITLQGGEPMLYWKGQGLGEILQGLPHYFDLLTNFALKPETFVAGLKGQHQKLMRDAPYPSIRVSYHPAEMERVWHGKGFEELVNRCKALAEHGFRVSPTKAESDVGIYMVAHEEHEVTDRMRKAYGGRVPFETKEFLGVHKGKLYGSYLYPFSTNLLASGIHSRPLACECRTTELLLDPLGFVWRCHFYLYESWIKHPPVEEFETLGKLGFRYAENQGRLFPEKALRPLGHILDPDFSMTALREFRPCNQYGQCIGCDTKIKNNRFQSLDDMNLPHTSVEIRNIQFPAELAEKLEHQVEVAHPIFRQRNPLGK